MALREDIESKYGLSNEPKIDTKIGFGVENFIDSGAIYTWHDSGHAKNKEQMGIIDHAQFMEQTHQNLLGFHLKDGPSKGLGNQALGTGTVDFAMVKSYFKPNHVLVIDLSPRLKSEEVIHSRDYLLKLIGER